MYIQWYRSAFRIEFTKCFVTLQFDRKQKNSYRIDSIPICRPLYDIYIIFILITIILSISNEICPTKNISLLTWYFRSLVFSEQLRLNSSEYLRTRTQLIEFVIIFYQFLKTMINFFFMIFLNFSKDETNKSRLTIQINFNQYLIDPFFLQKIMKFIQRHVTYFNISMKQPKQIEILFERCQNLDLDGSRTILGEKYIVTFNLLQICALWNHL